MTHKTVISQYKSDHGNISLFVKNIYDSLNITQDLTDFHAAFWDIDTATGHFLDVWGVIVGVNRNIEVPVDEDFLGFKIELTPDSLLQFLILCSYPTLLRRVLGRRRTF